ncbi:hypothetical protein F5Y07DRAFT_167553 [Xylaria sp. FL0933]|nr:hypothetical protein F5Y07DRAFT_167553 [Xylaria sp. FL0933]
MSLFSSKNHAQIAEFWVILIASLLGVVLTVLRFIATSRSQRRRGYEDWFALAALTGFILFAISSLLGLTVGDGEDITLLAVQNPRAFATSRKWIFVGLYGYFLNYLFTKLSVLALYQRVFGVDKNYLRWIYSLAVFEILWVIAISILQGLQCQPVHKFWQPEVDGHCISEGALIVVLEIPNSISDFAMVGLILVMIRPLHINPADKLKLRILFSLGGVVGILGFIKIGVTYSTNSIYSFNKIGVISFVQALLSTFCCCAPTYATLVPRSNIFAKLSSRLNSYKLWTRRSSNTPTEQTLSTSKSAHHVNVDLAHDTHGWVALDDWNPQAHTWSDAAHHTQ